MKTTNLIQISCSFLLLLFSTIVNGQDLDASVRLIDIPNVDSVVIANYTISLPDTQIVSDIEYKLGYTDNYELLNASVPYGNIPTVLGVGPIFRNGNKIFISVGEISKYPSYFGYVRWKSNNGTWSNPFQFVFN